ncbi:mechanosensitive ion channel family protein [Roseivirga echinicomitans]
MITNLFETYKLQLLYAVIVVASILLLRYFTNILHKWLISEDRRKFPGETLRPVHLIKRILNGLWLVLGVIILILIFSDETRYESLISDFKLIFYLGFLAICTIVGAASVNMWFKQSISKKISSQEDPTSLKFLGYVVVYGIYFLGLFFGLLAFPSFRNVAQTALGGAGVIAIIAGIASQEALANLVGGVFIISFKPFKIGDVIKVSDTMVGTVTDITLRHTIIRNFENKMIVIPNSIINSERLINYDLGERKCCEHIEIGISYDSDVKLAKSIMQQECQNHPLILDNRSELDKANDLPVVRVALTKLNDSSVTIRAWAWASNYSNTFQLRIDVLESIKARFEREGIEIPFPYRTLVMKKENSEEKVTTAKGEE